MNGRDCKNTNRAEVEGGRGWYGEEEEGRGGEQRGDEEKKKDETKRERE